LHKIQEEKEEHEIMRVWKRDRGNKKKKKGNNCRDEEEDDDV
jgi:hypothetical protein